jgi:hypothetical protein
MISEVALEISVIAEPRGELDAEAYVEALRRLDALRTLLSKAGITSRGTRPASLPLTARDNPTLALRALELEYGARLTRVEDAESSGFTASTRLLIDLGELVAALRERLDVDSDEAK